MAFERPSLSALVTRIEADFVSRLTAGGALVRRSVVKVLARVMAGAMHLLYGNVNFVSKQILPDTAEAEYLDRHAGIWGITRHAATYAEGTVTFTGTNGTLIPSGTELSSPDGKTYTTDANGTISAGSATVAITASEAGTESNLDVASELSPSSPIAGIDSTVTVATATDATDTESDEDLLERVLTRIQTPPAGGTENDYITWAKEVAGVTRAWCFPERMGPGTVGVTFVRDDDEDIIPSAGELTEVEDYIEDRRPVTATVTVFAPTPVELDFEIDGVADAAVRTAIEAELEDLIRREAEPEGTLLISHIREAISKAEGEEDHDLVSPAADVVAGTGELTVMGTITWG